MEGELRPLGCGESTSVGMLERWYKMGTLGLEDMTSKNTSHWYTILSFLLPLPPTPFLSPSLLLHSLTLGIVWTSLIDRARVTRASTVRNDHPREHHVANRPRRRCSRRGEIIEAATMANIHKFISSLPNGFNTRVEGTRGASCLVGRQWIATVYTSFFPLFSCMIFDFRFSISDSLLLFVYLLYLGSCAD